MEQGDARVRIGEGWRLVIPAALRPRLGVKVGQEVLLRDTPGGVLLTTFDQAVAESQNLVARYIPPTADLQADLHALRSRDPGRA